MSYYNFQGARIVAPVSFETQELLYVNNLLNMKQERFSLEGQRWKISFSVEPEGNSNILVHMVSRLTSTFSFTVPQPDDPTMNEPLVATVQNTASAGTNGFVCSETLPVGRFIKFANHSKVYLVTSSAAGVTTIYPNLHSDIPATTEVFFGNNVTMTVFYDDSQSRGITFEDGLLSNPGTITLIENP